MFSGRLMPEKGLYDLLEAMALVVPQADCTLLIAGEGEIEGDLRRRAAELGLQDKVEFLGFLDQDELGAVYARSDMLVLPSYYAEGFPTVISEAMSRGLPVVTTPIRGAADHLVEGENVLFVPPHAPREVAEAILRLAGDEPLRRRLGENNLVKVKDFAPERVVRDYLAVFEEVAEALVGRVSRRVASPDDACRCARPGALRSAFQAWEARPGASDGRAE